jgi:hypothetical protein
VLGGVDGSLDIAATFLPHSNAEYSYAHWRLIWIT